MTQSGRTTDAEHEARADGWVDAVFGDRTTFSRNRVPGSAIWLLAFLADPEPTLTFGDWEVRTVDNDRATGKIVAITSSKIIYVTFTDCPIRQDPTTRDQLSGWVRPRRSVRMIEFGAGPNMFSANYRAPGCLRVNLDDGEVLTLPLGGRLRTDLASLVRQLAPA